MNIIEAVKAAMLDKKIRRKKWLESLRDQDTYLTSDEKNDSYCGSRLFVPIYRYRKGIETFYKQQAQFSQEELLADDWEVVE